MKLWHLVLVALVATVLWEVAPPAAQHMGVLGRRVDERRRYRESGDMDEMARKYPATMSKVAEDTMEELGRGVWAPVLERAWDTNSWVLLVRGIKDWVANNFVVRVLSPQTPWECAGLFTVLVFVGFVTFAVLNLVGSLNMANTMRHNAEVKRASKPVFAMPPTSSTIKLAGDD